MMLARLQESPWTRRVVLAFAWCLAGILVGFMFLGRGFSHIGVGPVYLGEAVLVLGIVALVVVRPPLHWLHAVLVVFMAWSFFRTVPYVTTYGMTALRDGVLWGYALFAIIVSALADRGLLDWITGWYGRVAVAFVLWLPPAWWVFGNYGEQLPRAPGSDVSILFFKNQDMAVHLAGIGAFIVVGGLSTTRGRWFLRELAVAVTGEMHSVRDFVELAFGLVGLDWHDHVKIDPRYFRPTEVDEVCGDASKARQVLGWAPRTSFPELVRVMLASDIAEAGLDPDRLITGSGLELSANR